MVALVGFAGEAEIVGAGKLGAAKANMPTPNNPKARTASRTTKAFVVRAAVLNRLILIASLSVLESISSGAVLLVLVALGWMLLWEERAMLAPPKWN